MSYSTPAAASAAGERLWIEIGADHTRPMSHVFLLADGGVAWDDHGWTDGLGGGHPCHHIPGEWRRDAARWLLQPEDGSQPKVIRPGGADYPEGRPDGERDEARALLILDQGISLAEDP